MVIPSCSDPVLISRLDTPLTRDDTPSGGKLRASNKT